MTNKIYICLKANECGMVRCPHFEPHAAFKKCSEQGYCPFIKYSTRCKVIMGYRK